MLDSAPLAAQLSDIQAFRYLTGNTRKGLNGLRFTMSNDAPPRITGVKDTDNQYAFPQKPDDPQRTLDPENIPAMRRSTAERILAMTPEFLAFSLGNTVDSRGLQEATTRLTRLQAAIRKGLEHKWPEKDALIQGRIHVMDDKDFEKLSVKQLAAAQADDKKGLFSQVYSGVVLKGAEAAEENRRYPGGLYQKGMADLMETQEDKDSSPAFNRAMNGVKKLNRELVKYLKEDRPLAEEELPKLRKLYSECLGDVSQYVTATSGWRWTSRGDQRHNAMATMQNFMRKELDALYKYDPAKNWKLEKIIDHARQEEIILPVDQNEKVGGNLHQREVMTINGKKGVFTPRTMLDTSLETLRVRYLDPVTPENFPNGQRREQMRAIGEMLFRNRDEIVNKYFFSVLSSDSFERDFANADEEYMNQQDVKDLIDDLNSALRLRGLPEISKNQDEGSKKYRKGIAKLLENAFNLENERSLYETAGIQHGTCIDQRNTAMSVTADLLEAPAIMARAHDVRIKRGEAEQQGTFMEWADGIERRSKTGVLRPGTTGNDFTRANSNLMTREALQNLSDIQVADFISGNLDRHLSNVMYKFENENGEVRLKKITGIDNDLSGGAIFMKDVRQLTGYQDKGQMVLPEDMLMMKQSTANAVLNLTKDTVEAAYRPYLKGRGEIEAQWDRIKALQDQIRKDASYRWKGPHALASGHIRVFADDDPVWDSFRPGAFLNQRNIFGKFDKDIAMVAEDQKKYLPGNAAKNPYLKQHLKPDHPNHDLMTRLDYHPMPEHTKLKFLSRVIKDKDGQRSSDFAQLYRMLGTEADILNNDRFVNGASKLSAKLNDQLSSLGIVGQLSGFFNNNGLKAAGIKQLGDLFYIDGVPFREFIKRNYPNIENSELYQVTQGVMKDEVDGQLISVILSSGRHHVDLAVPGMDRNGNFCTDITELTMDVEQLLGTEGKFGTSRITRQNRLLKDNTREARFRNIDTQVKNRMTDAAEKLDLYFKKKDQEALLKKGDPVPQNIVIAPETAAQFDAMGLRRPKVAYADLLKDPVELNEIVGQPVKHNENKKDPLKFNDIRNAKAGSVKRRHN